MKKIILCALISLLSLAITGCDEFGKYSVSPHDNSTNTFELLFDEIGQSMLIKKEISIDISDDSNYTGNFVGPAGVVTMEYTLHNTTDEPVDFQMLWIYPIYGSSNLSNLFETLVLEIDDVVQERIYNVIFYEQNPDNQVYDDFTYSNAFTLIGDVYTNIEDVNIPSTRKDLCTLSTQIINPQSNMKVKIILPAWPKGRRTNPAPDLEYLLILDKLYFGDVETTITVFGNRPFNSTNHTKDESNIIINKDSNNTVYVGAAFKSPHYSSWTPYCSYKG